MGYRSHTVAEERSIGRPGKGMTALKRVVISSFDNPTHPHYNGGGVTMIEMMADRLSADFEVTIVTSGGRGEMPAQDRVRYRTLPIGWAGPRTGQLLYHMLLPIFMQRIPHDLWIENFTPPFSTSFLPLFTRARIVGFAQSLCGKEMSVRYRLPFFLIERLGLRFYRDVVVLNPADQELVRKYSPSASVHLIPNGIRIGSLNERAARKGDHILFLGRIDVWKKGLDMLLAAYEKSGVSMPLIIAGSGVPREERKLLDLLAATTGDVRWVGHVSGEHKQDLLERSAFMVMPSRYETFGLTALESMCLGKPVLHFDLPTLGWMNGDVRTAPYEVSALADQIRYLTNNDVARQELGRTAYRAAQRYSYDDTGNRYATLVRELLDAALTQAEAGDASPRQ
jgi:glycosyltransferase involved in cell wall biosynthesis